MDRSSSSSSSEIDNKKKDQVTEEALEAFINECEKQHIVTSHILKNIKLEQLVFINQSAT
jgi:DNA-binding transcriptional regulator YhcF (GntR family)